jgi:hypothetical protein
MQFAMFEHELRPEPSFGSFVIQQLGAFIGSVVLSIVVGSTLNELGVAGEILAPVIAGVISFVIGMMVRGNAPDSAAIGRWVWVPPVCVFLIVFAREWASSSLPPVFAEFFWPGPNGEAWWVLGLFTVPTACCCLYSAGIVFAGRRLGPKRDDSVDYTPNESGQ